jgi:uncharacterized protein with gpF-like domain
MMLRIDTQADVLARLFQEAEQTIRQQIVQALASGALRTAAYRRAQLAVVQQHLAALHSTAIPAAREQVARAYGDGVVIANTNLPKAKLATAFSGGFHSEAVNALADSLTTKLDAAITHVGRRADDVFRREGLRQTTLGMLQGQGAQETAAQLASTLADQGVKAFIDSAGRSWGLDTYARMAIRTTGREAVTAGTKNRLAEAGLDLVTWTAAWDADDDPCQSNDGQTFSMSGSSSDYPALTDEPPAHPNCRCVLTPAAENLEAQLA